jgi:membrane-associated phospholipid phosphatase
MKQIFLANRIFFIAYSFWLLLAVILCFVYSQASLSMYINSITFPGLDNFAKYFTHVGDGLFAVIVSILLLIYDRKIGTLVILSYLLSAGITQSLKHTLYADAARPIQFFWGTRIVHFIDGVSLHAHNSFPSGHTTSIFSLCSLLAFTFKKYGNQIFLFSIALIAGLTRVYLLQHYLIDVLAGSFIGVLSSILLYYWLKDKALFKK